MFCGTSALLRQVAESFCKPSRAVAHHAIATLVAARHRHLLLLRPVKKERRFLRDISRQRPQYLSRPLLSSGRRTWGFAVIQAPTTPDEHARAEEDYESPQTARTCAIDFVRNMEALEKIRCRPSGFAVVAKKLAGMRTSLHNAKLLGIIRKCYWFPPVVNSRQTLLSRPTHGSFFPKKGDSQAACRPRGGA